MTDEILANKFSSVLPTNASAGKVRCECSYFLSQDLGDSVIDSHGPKLYNLDCNVKLLKIVYSLNMQDEVSKRFAISF